MGTPIKIRFEISKPASVPKSFEVMSGEIDPSRVKVHGFI